MTGFENILSEKLKSLIQHGGHIIIEKDGYYIQCIVTKGEPVIYAEAASHHELEVLPGNLAGDFKLLGYKIDKDAAVGNYAKEYASSFTQQNISAVISDIEQIFENIYKTDTNTEFQIKDNIDYPAVIEARKKQEKEWRRSNRNSLLVFGFLVALIAGGIYWNINYRSGSPTDKTALTLDELETFQAEEQKELEKYTAKRDALTAVELIELSDCSDLSCVQLYMKNKQPDFIYAEKGEYGSRHRGAVKDTTGKEIIISLSTFYVETNAQASWKAAHTLHSKTLADSLMNEFSALGFQFADKRYYADVKAEGSRYVSEKYPGKSLYVTATFNPWQYKNLYLGGVSWYCWMFEVYED